MAQSPALRKEVSVMGRLERAMSDLPDDRARSRVADWFAANYIEEPASPNGRPSTPADAVGADAGKDF